MIHGPHQINYFLVQPYQLQTIGIVLSLTSQPTVISKNLNSRLKSVLFPSVSISAKISHSEFRKQKITKFLGSGVNVETKCVNGKKQVVNKGELEEVTCTGRIFFKFSRRSKNIIFIRGDIFGMVNVPSILQR